MDFKDFKDLKNTFQVRLKEKVPSMNIETYMQGLFQISSDLNMEIVDINSDVIKFTCPLKMKGSEELKSLSGNLEKFIRLKLLVKYI